MGKKKRVLLVWFSMFSIYVVQSAKFSILGIFDIRRTVQSPCDRNHATGEIYLEKTIEFVKYQNKKVLHGDHSLSLVTVDTCGDERIALKNIMYALADSKLKNPYLETSGHSNFLLGFLSVTTLSITEKLASLATSLNIPLICITEPGDDTLVNRNIFPTTIRLSPSLRDIAKAMSSTMKLLKWGYAQSVYSLDSPYRELLPILQEEAMKLDVCLLKSFPVTREAENISEDLLKEAATRGVLLLTNKNDTKKTLTRIEKDNTGLNFTFIVHQKSLLDQIGIFDLVLNGSLMLREMLPQKIGSLTKQDDSFVMFIEAGIRMYVDSLRDIVQTACIGGSKMCADIPYHLKHKMLKLLGNSEVKLSNGSPVRTENFLSAFHIMEVLQLQETATKFSWIKVAETQSEQYTATIKEAPIIPVLTSKGGKYREECRPHVNFEIAVSGPADAYLIGITRCNYEVTTPSACGNIVTSYSILAEMFLYMVHEINKDPRILPNINLGSIILNSCYHPERIVTQLDAIFSGKIKLNTNQNQVPRLIAAVGPMRSSSAAKYSEYLRPRDITLLSLSSSSPLLSDKSKYPNVNRMVAPDSKQAEAMLGIVKYFKWKYIGVVYTDTTYGKFGIREVLKLSYQSNIKVGYQIRMSAKTDQKDSNNLFKTFILGNIDSIKVVICFLTTGHTQLLFKSAKEFHAKGIVWIMSDTWVDSVGQKLSGLEEYASGAIGVQFLNERDQQFLDYIKKLDIGSHKNNPFLLRLFEHLEKCYFLEGHRKIYEKRCDSNARFNMSKIDVSYDAMAADALKAVALGFHDYIDDHCPDRTFCEAGKKDIGRLSYYIRQQTFNGTTGNSVAFNSKGDGMDRYIFFFYQQERHTDGSNQTKYKNIEVGTWNSGNMSLSNDIKFYDSKGKQAKVVSECKSEHCVSTTVEILDMDYLYLDGDLILYVFLPIHSRKLNDDKCSEDLDLENFQILQAVNLALQEINKDSNFLPGVRLGLAAFDTCGSASHTRTLAEGVFKPSFVVQKKEYDFRNLDPVGIIGGIYDEEVLSLERTVRRFNSNIPIVSLASSSTMNDKSAHPNFFRTVSSETEVLRLMVQLLRRMNWNYIHVVYTDTESQRESVDNFMREVHKHVICLATKQAIDPTKVKKEDYDAIIEKMLSVEGATVVVLFVDAVLYTRGLMEAGKRQNTAGKLFWISPATLLSKPEVIRGIEEIALGLLTVRADAIRNDEFDRFFQSLTLEKNEDFPWFQEFWQKYFQCNLELGTQYGRSCPGDLHISMPSLGNYTQTPRVTAALNAVFVTAHALHEWIVKCNVTDKDCVNFRSTSNYLNLTSIMDIIRFQVPGGEEFAFFDRNGTDSLSLYNLQLNNDGDARYIKIGSYASGHLSIDQKLLTMYRQGARILPDSTCPGKCIACVSEEFLKRYNKRVAQLVKLGPSVSHKFNQATGVVVLMIICLNFLLLIVALHYFRKYHYHEAFRFSLDANVFILFGILLMSLSGLIFLYSPTEVICGVQTGATGVSYCIVVAALFIKVAKVSSTKKMTAKQSKMAPAWSFVPTFYPIPLGAQAIILAAWYLNEEPRVIYTKSDVHSIREVDEVVLKWDCAFDKSSYLVSLTFCGIILIHTIILSAVHRSKQIPHNACPHVFTASVGTFFGCAMWLTIFILVSDYDLYCIVMALALPINAMWILLCVFSPKIIALFFDEKKINTDILLLPASKLINLKYPFIKHDRPNYGASYNPPPQPPLRNNHVLNGMKKVERSKNGSVAEVVHI